MAAALADLLPDFGARPRAAPARAAAPQPSPPPPPPPEPPPIDIDAIVAEAVARAEAEVAEKFSAEMEQRLQESDAAHQAEIDRIRSETGVEFGARLTAALADLEKQTIDVTTSVVARILGQMATDTVAQRAIEALSLTVRDVIGDAETIRIRVKGPQSLFLPFAAAMGEQSRHLQFVEADTVDLTVSMDETLFETRLAEWSQTLSENI